ncbi:hypothetical protein [Paraburkholderia xenovorans]|uniref:hypothetical protein n=1 Tax=Paraburkholderia xenovorans TaxID=36873 RepID=UPI0011D16614|nr:hypothetical protein [Paraburkholderia xenovorans]
MIDKINCTTNDIVAILLTVKQLDSITHLGNRMAEDKQLGAQLDELLKKVASGKATPTEKIKLSTLLNESAKVEAQQEKQEKIDKVLALIDELELSRSEVAEALNGPAEVLIRYVDDTGQVHERYDGETATNKWLKALKEAGTHNFAQAKELIVAKSADGKAKATKTLDRLYHPEKYAKPAKA